MQTDQVLDGSLIACDVVRGGDGPWRVRFAVRLEATQRSTGEMVVARAYEAERTLPGAGTDGLGAAMGDCVADVVQQALADWTQEHETDPITRPPRPGEPQHMEGLQPAEDDDAPAQPDESGGR